MNIELPIATLLTCVLFIFSLGINPSSSSTTNTDYYDNIENIFVFYFENWSFDTLFGYLDGVESFVTTSATIYPQIDKNGVTYTVLPRDAKNITPPNLPNKPWDYATLNFVDGVTDSNYDSVDITHRFYTEQVQIHNGKMDLFDAWSSANGVANSYLDIRGSYFSRVAKRYVICDKYFHSAFGGSFLNHQWLIAAQTPIFYNISDSLYNTSVSTWDANGVLVNDNIITPDKYAVNTIQPTSRPHQNKATVFLPPQQHTTIGDTLSSAGVSWKWYSGGYNNAMAGTPGTQFQYHHQPFVYYSRFANESSPDRLEHLKDEEDLLADLIAGTVPSVSFWKPYGETNFHPAYAKFGPSDQKLKQMVQAVQNSTYWNKSLIIITFDENGGRWDHVPPPNGDRWGPGTRIPTILVSPYLRNGTVDSTQYETISILKFIETKFNLSVSLIPSNRTVNTFDRSIFSVNRTDEVVLEPLVPESVPQGNTPPTPISNTPSMSPTSNTPSMSPTHNGGSMLVSSILLVILCFLVALFLI